MLELGGVDMDTDLPETALGAIASSVNAGTTALRGMAVQPEMPAEMNAGCCMRGMEEGFGAFE